MAVFKAELNTVNIPACVSCGRIGDAGANVSGFLARKKEEVTAIAKMSLTSVDVKASTIIVYSSMRSSVQNGIKTALHLVARNYDSTKARSHQLGCYLESDVDSIPRSKN